MTTQTSLVEQARELLLSDTQRFYALMRAERCRIYGGTPPPMARIEVDLSGIDLSNERIASTGDSYTLGLEDICFTGAKLIGTTFACCSLARSSFSGAGMRIAQFDDCDLSGVDLRGLLQQSVMFSDCDMSYINCEDSDIQELIAIRCCFDGAKMARANMQHVNMDSCTFDHADFTDADMRWANFYKSSIYGAKGLTRRFYRRHRLAVERSIGFAPK